MTDAPEQRPEGALLEAVMRRKGVKTPWVAQRVNLSANRVRQIINGYRALGVGGKAPERAPADTLARLAHVLGITPQQLVEVGREDAARDLEAMIAVSPEPVSDLSEDKVRALQAIADNRNRPDYMRNAARALLTALASADDLLRSEQELEQEERRRAS